MALVNRDRQSGRQRKKNLVLGAILNEADLPMHRLYPIQLTKHPSQPLADAARDGSCRGAVTSLLVFYFERKPLAPPVT